MKTGPWVETLVALSIFVPVVIAAILAWFFLRGAKNDPDEQRLRQVQEEAERARRTTQHR